MWFTASCTLSGKLSCCNHSMIECSYSKPSEKLNASIKSLKSHRKWDADTYKVLISSKHRYYPKDQKHWVVNNEIERWSI